MDGLILFTCAGDSPRQLDGPAKELQVVAVNRDLSEAGTRVHGDHFRGALQATVVYVDLNAPDGS